MGVAEMADALGTAHAEKREVIARTRDFESSVRDRQITADPNRHLVNVKSVTASRKYREERLAAGAGADRGAGGKGASRAGAKALTVREQVAARALVHAELGRTRGLPYVTGATDGGTGGAGVQGGGRVDPRAVAPRYPEILCTFITGLCTCW